MSYKIEDIQGVGPAYAEKLAKADIVTTADLLAKCGTPAGRKSAAETTGLSGTLILKWTNLADLMRISGVGPQFSELMEGAGVDTVKELRTRNAENLSAKMAEVNQEKKLCKASPSATVVEGWIRLAKDLDPGVTY